MNRKLLLQKYWLVKIKKGDTESFAKLYDELASRIYRFVFFKVNNVEEAEDITSQVFLKVWHYIQEGEEEIRSIRAFVYRITRNLIIDYYRTKSQSLPLEYKTIQDDERILSQLVDKSLREEMEQKSDLVIMYKALQQLKDEYREIIVLKYIDELSTKEIGQVLNKNSNAVRAQLLRALTALKELLPTHNLDERTGVHKKTKETAND